MRDTISLRFQGITEPVVLSGAEDLLPAIECVFPGWPWRRLSRRSPKPAIISVTKEGNKFRRNSRWVEEPDLDDDPADAMCDFVSDVLDAYIEEHPGTLGIHASAVRLGQGLIIFPSTHRSGKSLLTTHLVSQGAVLFSDDVLLLPRLGTQGMATGIAPRLRLPVPKESGSTLPAFLARSGMCANHRYGWVCLRPGEVASLGDRAAIKAIVILDVNDASKEPKLESVPRSEGLARMVQRGFAMDAKAGHVLECLSKVVGQAECFKLTYGAAGKAAEYLCNRFASAGGRSKKL